jgi:hypothetical protein
MELSKISCDSVINRIEIPSLLYRSILFDEEWENNGIFFYKYKREIKKNAWGWKWENVYNTRI